MQDDLRYITFKQFIYTVDIGQYINEKMDATSIRIYTDLDKDKTKDNWFDLGFYDWSFKASAWKFLEKVLSKEILNSYVERIWIDDTFDILCIDLVSKPTESLSSCKN